MQILYSQCLSLSICLVQTFSPMVFSFFWSGPYIIGPDHFLSSFWSSPLTILLSLPVLSSDHHYFETLTNHIKRFRFQNHSGCTSLDSLSLFSHFISLLRYLASKACSRLPLIFLSYQDSPP